MDKLSNFLKDNNLDSLLISDKYSLRYFTGFTGSTGVALVMKDKKFFFTDFRYMEQADLEVKINGFEIVKVERNAVDKVVEYIINSASQNLGIEDKTLTVGVYNSYKEKLNNIEIVYLEDKLVKLRMVKKEVELELMRKAADIADKAFLEILPLIKEGVVEKDLATELEYAMQKFGAQKASFETIVASNYRSAMPHGVASEKKIAKNGFVKFDFGAYYNGYASDMTRTVFYGDDISDKHLDIYNTVLEAQKRAVASVKAGVMAKDVDKVARDYITEKGYGENFGHGTGHGLGLEVHEYPFVNTKDETILLEGMVVTIEPGIYIEGFGGVRIEDDVVVRKDGCEILNKTSKELIILK